MGACVFAVFLLDLQPSAGGSDLFLGPGARAGVAVLREDAVHLQPGSSLVLQLFLSDQTDFEGIKTCIHPSSWHHSSLIHKNVKSGRKRRLARPPVLHIRGPWRGEMDFNARLAAA